MKSLFPLLKPPTKILPPDNLPPQNYDTKIQTHHQISKLDYNMWLIVKMHCVIWALAVFF